MKTLRLSRRLLSDRPPRFSPSTSVAARVPGIEIRTSPSRLWLGDSAYPNKLICPTRRRSILSNRPAQRTRSSLITRLAMVTRPCLATRPIRPSVATPPSLTVTLGAEPIVPGVVVAVSQPLDAVEGTLSDCKTTTTGCGVKGEDVVPPTGGDGIRTIMARTDGMSSAEEAESQRSTGGREDRD